MKRHLTAARNTLNEIAKLTPTAQLNENARVQLSSRRKAKLIAFRSQLNAFEGAADRTKANPDPRRDD